MLLTTDTAEFGVRAENMPYTDSWDDADVEVMVQTWLIQFEV